MVTDASEDAARRLRARPWDHDFMVMRQIASAYRGVISRHLSGRHDLTVVDYGCGPMPYKPLFEPNLRTYIGADLPDNPVANVHLRDDGALPVADESADVVISSQVLEHVLDVGHYLSECRRVLRPGGLLLLSTHGMWVYHPHPTDVRRWTRWGLSYEIENCGFKSVEALACVGPLAYTTQLRLLLAKGLLLKFGLLGRALFAPIALFSQGLMWLEDRITPAAVLADNAAVYVVAAQKA
jgi:SAM-dependent methyltransferase